ncbi:rod shape-determining protein MreC [Caulobacter mirabilis]|uniref:Cell shape-determining protein MreC n=1 Tax=Caulobacter mirabilis TaxID=69666 RepID=A0A2D2B0G4_9CAUL|nr:rod shape-determining protein MreC [Caulobacter mirabilis]ATQ43745.1 rod shape-determining protein MreC [Caulobacter mirabilis]
MPFRQDPFGELKVPLTWTAAVALVVAVVIGVAMLLSDRRETFQSEAYGVARQAVDTVAEPVSGVVAKPGEWTGDIVGFVRGYFFAASENRRLKQQVIALQTQADEAVRLQDENERLRAVLGVRTDPPIPMITARVVTDSRGPFANYRLANAGTKDGVMIGFPVLAERGLVGRVVGVSGGASKVLLLTDAASKTPVMVDRTNARAILTGDGGPNPKLEYLRSREPLKEGDRVLTSGDGGVIPRGLPVGRAVKGLDGRWRVVLDADSSVIDWVRILQFRDYAQLVDRKALEQTQLPPVITENPDDRIVRAPAAAGAQATAAPTAATPPRTAAPAAQRPATTTAPAPKAAAPRPAAQTPRPASTQPAPTPAPTGGGI